MRGRHVAGTLALAALLASCGGSGGSGGGAPGTLRLALTDAPGCGFDHVYVTIDKIRVHASASAQDAEPGWTDVPVSRRRIDLLTLTNGALEELGTAALPAGHYQQLRLVLAANDPAADLMANAVLPSGASQERPLLGADAQGGLKVAAAIEVAAGRTADTVIDFDACRSVATGKDGSYHLKPVIAAMPRNATGIEGAVAAPLAMGSTTISAQRDGMAVRSTRPDADGKFSIPYLEPGSYTLVIASDGRATGVVTDVPVRNGMTSVGSPSAAIALPASSMSEITGAASIAEEAGTASALTEALARAGQVLANGQPVEVSVRPVDAAEGTYRLRVPTAPIEKAAYDASGVLSFKPDGTDAGRYSVDVLLSGQ